MIEIADNPAVRAQVKRAVEASNKAATDIFATPVESAMGAPSVYPAKELALQNGQYVVTDQSY